MGAARLGSADSPEDFRDSGGKARFGRAIDIPGERPGLGDCGSGLARNGH